MLVNLRRFLELCNCFFLNSKHFIHLFIVCHYFFFPVSRSPVSYTHLDVYKRQSHYLPYEEEIIMKDIPYPVAVNKIKRFEKLNENISVKVFGYEGEVYPLRITEHRGRKYHVNLLLLSDANTTHYCLIRNLSRMLSSLSKRNGASFYCNYCLHRFSDNKDTNAARKRVEEHERNCSQHAVQKVKLPDENEKWMYFKNFSLCHRVPYTVYADFESFIVPTTGKNVAYHIPASFCYVIVDWMGNAVKEDVYKRQV